MALQSRKQCKAVAQRLKDKEHLFVLGKGFAEPVAYEGALKIKETCYLHAEGYSGGALKHGPFALIEDSSGKFGATPIILIVLDDENKNSMITACEEVRMCVCGMIGRG
jgi:glutamine---fructose-6-phosphate transaminase (isomerizing)